VAPGHGRAVSQSEEKELPKNLCQESLAVAVQAAPKIELPEYMPSSLGDEIRNVGTISPIPLHCMHLGCGQSRTTGPPTSGRCRRHVSFFVSPRDLLSQRPPEASTTARGLKVILPRMESRYPADMTANTGTSSTRARPHVRSRPAWLRIL